MTSTLQHVKRLLVAALYLFVIAVGGSVLLSDPNSAYIVVPVIAAIIVAAHALRADALDEFGYGVMGFLGTVLLIALAAGAGAAVGSVPTPSDAMTMLLGTVALLTAYVFTLQDGIGIASG